MKKLLIIIGIFISQNAMAQMFPGFTRSNSLEIDAGSNQLKENNLHPKVHSGLMPGIIYNRYRLSAEKISNFSTGLNFTALKTAYENSAESMNVNLFFGYRQLFKVYQRSNYFVAAGPDAQLIYNFSFFPNWDESHLYWANQLTIGTSGAAFIKLSESKNLIFDLKMGLASLASRPLIEREYKIDDLTFEGVVSAFHSNVAFLTVNRSFNFSFRTEYQFNTSTRLSPAVLYEFSVQKLNTPVSHSFINIHHKTGIKFYF
jgi:hypothetical protein